MTTEEQRRDGIASAAAMLTWAMRITVLLLLLIIASFRALAGWQMIDYYPGYSITPEPDRSLTFPPSDNHAHYPAFLVWHQPEPMDLSNATISCTFTLTASPDATFRFGGQGTWNTGSRPPHTRLYFATVDGYDNEGPATNYWFNGASMVVISNNTGTATLTATLDHFGGWTHGQGSTNGFWEAANHAVAVGICFGGGSYYDIGLSLTSGAASLQIESFTVTPRYRLKIEDSQISVTGGYWNDSYQIQHGLIDWVEFGTLSGTNRIPATEGFFRAIRL